MQRQTSLAVWCERLLEGGWLFAVLFIPSYFNLLSSRHFEPDKATSLRALVLLMLAVAAIGWLERLGNQPPRDAFAAPASGNPLRRLWQRARAFPLAVPTIVYVLVFLLATAVSITPSTSFWGSYQRLQGTYTNISYVLLGALVVLHLRRRDQLERLVSMSVLASLIAIGYGLVQHLQIDPLPWRGDVITRVASTMGNSIFVAAYLIMVLPLALYRAITSIHQARQAPPSDANTRADIGWAAAYLLLILGGLLLVYAAIKFGAVVRTNDLRYWWVYPLALLVTFALYLVPVLRPHAAERLRFSMLVPGIALLLYSALLGIFYISAGQSEQVVQTSDARGFTGLHAAIIQSSWGVWLFSSLLLVIVAYLLMFALPSRAGAPSRIWLWMVGVGALVVSLLTVLTIIFTQSRGPWLGAAVGLFLFFTLLLVQARRRARAIGASNARLWSGLLLGELVLTLAAVGFILVFNFSDAPAFQQLRKVPYIGRMGQLLDVSAGTTGDVRMKIWVGDDKAGGAVALILSDPVRTIVGWGPESMFVAYNKFYPPSLANVESRGASPDRSHEAYLDELVTKGVLGLLSYLFVLFSFFWLVARLIRRTDDWPMQVFFTACLTVVISHAIEGAFGIPIVATLMTLWLTMAMTVCGGHIVGQYTLDAPAEAAAENTVTDAAPTPAVPAKAPVARGAGRRAQAVRQGRVATVNRRASQRTNPVSMLLYGMILVLALVGGWFWNVDNVYADMYFQQSQLYTDNPRAGLDQQLTGMGFLLDAIKMEPEQDFYYLNLGRNLMSIADIRRQTQGTPPGQPKSDAYYQDLVYQPDSQAAQQFVMQQGLLETMSYTEAVLQHAYDLSPLNKDNAANLGRLNTFWYSRFQPDPKRIQNAVNWYENAHDTAPQDVVILNEYAGAKSLQGTYAEAQKDNTAAQSYYDEATKLLQQSKQLDPRYSDTDLRIADLLRIQKKYAEATDQYLAALNTNPNALDGQIASVISAMRDRPDQLQRLRSAYEAGIAKNPKSIAPLYATLGQLAALTGDMAAARDAYAQQTKLQPQSLDAVRNYTLTLSETKEYQAALVQAQTLLQLAQAQQSQQDTSDAQALIQYFQSR